MSEENKAIVRHLIEEVINKGNLALFDEVYGDCVYCSPATGELKREALRQFVASLLAAFPDGQWKIEDQVAEGDKVATRWSFTGTHQGQLMGMAPTGKRVTCSGMVIDRIIDGKIVEEREEWDALGMMQQLGAAPQSTQANKAVMRRWIEEGHNKRNLTVADEVCDPAFVWRLAPVGEIRGPEALKEMVKSIHTAFPNWQVTVEEQIAEGDMVATRKRATGTHQGEFMGIAPTGKQVTTSTISIARIAGGKFVEGWEVWDAYGMLQQLGATSPVGGRAIAREAVFNAAKAAYSAYGGLLKDVVQEMGMEKAVALHAKRCQAFYVAFAGMIRDRLGGNEFDLSTFSSALKDVNNTIFGCIFEIEESPGSLRCSYLQCPIYPGFSSAGLDHRAIELICTGGESSGLAELKKALPQVSGSLRFRPAPDQSCVQEFVLEK
jgi:steroid delta-isomerase-like uncharacterized protein